MLPSRPTLIFKPFIPRRPILYLLPLPPHHRPLLLEVFEPGALNYFNFSRPILSILSVSMNPILTPLPLRIPRFSALRSDRIHSWSGILSRDATHASDGVAIFVRRGLSFSELSTSSLSSLNPYFDYVGVNISLRNSSLLLFLNMYAPPIHSSPTDGRTDSFFPSRNLFILWDFNCQHPLWDSRGISDPRRGKYLI